MFAKVTGLLYVVFAVYVLPCLSVFGLTKIIDFEQHPLLAACLSAPLFYFVKHIAEKFIDSVEMWDDVKIGNYYIKPPKN